MTAVRVEYEADVETLAAGAVAAHASDPAVARQWAAARGVLALRAAVVVGCFAALYHLGWPAGGIAAVAALFTLLDAVTRWPGGRPFHRAVSAQLRQALADPAGAAAVGRRIVTATRDGLAVHTRYAREEYDWAGVTAVRRVPDFLVLTLPNLRPLAVPRTAFADDFAFDRFCEDVAAFARQAGGTP